MYDVTFLVRGSAGVKVHASASLCQLGMHNMH